MGRCDATAFGDERAGVWKTWANSWSTTRRYGEAIKWPCIFGCEGEENDLSHYINCSRLWSGILSASNLEEELIHVDPLVKLCLLNPSALWACLIAVAFRSYHAIIFNHRASVQTAVDSERWQLTAVLLSDLARHFWSEHRPALGRSPGRRLLLYVDSNDVHPAPSDAEVNLPMT